MGIFFCKREAEQSALKKKREEKNPGVCADEA